MHRFTTRYRQGNIPARLALVVVGLLFGLLGMHALSVGHGVLSGHTAQMHAQMSAQVSGETSVQVGDSGQAGMLGMSDHAASGASSHANAAAAPSETPSETRSGDGSGSGDHGMGGMLMLCLAVLGAAATVLGRVFARRLSWWRLALTSVVTAAIPATSASRGSGPPLVWEFSVIRC